MAKYVLLAFRDDERAAKFLQYMGVHDGDEMDTALAALEAVNYAEVQGEYKKPTQFCECGEMEYKTNHKQWALGQKFGWWIHRKCGKPNRKQAEGNSFPFLGRNLMGKKVGDKWEMK